LGEGYVIDIDNVSYTYGNNVKALSSVSIKSNLKDGILSILGPNGAGKTTLVNLMTTSLPLQSGNIKLFGYDVNHQRKYVRSIVALCAQELELDLLLSVWANLWSYGLIRGLKKEVLKQRIELLLKQFEMYEKRNVRVLQLSGGEMRRVQIIRALLDETAKLIFIDEPTLGLDPIGRKVTWDIIKEMIKGGHYFVLTTNDMAEVERLSSEIIFLYKGIKISETSVEDFKRKYAGRIRVYIRTKDAVTKNCIEHWHSEKKLNIISGGAHEFTLECKDILALSNLFSEILNKGGGIQELSFQQETLEDAFINLIKSLGMENERN
jgi:ABC-2 type transport system ATP-binding protein